MTKIDTSTEAVEALLKDVTPGPWFAERNSAFWEINPMRHHGDTLIPFNIGNVCSFDPGDTTGLQRINARFIAAARELVPALLAERDALQAEVERLKAQYNDVVSDRPYIVGWNDGYDFAEHGDEEREVPDVVAALVAKRLKAQPVAVLEAANRYLTEQYGISALGNAIDQERILSDLARVKGVM